MSEGTRSWRGRIAAPNMTTAVPREFVSIPRKVPTSGSPRKDARHLAAAELHERAEPGAAARRDVQADEPVVMRAGLGVKDGTSTDTSRGIAAACAAVTCAPGGGMTDCGDPITIHWPDVATTTPGGRLAGGGGNISSTAVRTMAQPVSAADFRNASMIGVP
jgi:hypothetical protein